jgi:hypothetical protein
MEVAVSLAVLPVHVNLELPLGALKPPDLNAPNKRIQQVHAEPASLQVDVSENHPAEVGDVADSAAARADRAEKRNGADDHDEVLRLDRKQEAEEDDSIGVENSERK